MMELKAHELSGYAVSSNVLLQDAAFGLEKFLMTLFGQAVGWFEEYAFLQGNGVGKPLGILNAAAAVKVNRNTGNHVKFVDVAAMLSHLLPSSPAGRSGCISPMVIAGPAAAQAGAIGRSSSASTRAAVKPPIWKLFGLPVMTTEKVPTLGTKGDCMLLDPRLYVIGDRMQLEIAASEHVNFLKNQMTWRSSSASTASRGWKTPITLQDGSTQVSPFVVLN